MAGLQACRSSYRDPLSGGKDEPSGGASTKGSDTYTPISAISHAFTFVPASAPLSNNELFQQFIKTYLENQNQNQAPFFALI